MPVFTKILFHILFVKETIFVFLFYILNIKIKAIENSIINKRYTTKEFKTPTAKTRRIHKKRPEKTVRFFSVQPSGEAKTTGTPTTKRKDNAMKARRVN